MHVTDMNAAWVAGLLEGEGCFVLSKRTDKPNTFIRAIHCEMTDEDVIRKLAALTGVGPVTLRLNTSGRRDTRKRKPTWIWSVQNKVDIKSVLTYVIPHLGARRKAKAEALYDEC